VGRLFGLRGPVLQERIGTLAERLGIAAALDRKIATYSRGMMQRVCLAQSLVNDPDLLILDEPTGGLDPIGRLEIRQLISELRSQGKTIFFSSHELSEVELVCDRIGILVQGRLAVEGPRDKVVPAGENLERYFMDVVAGKPEGARP